MGAYLYLVNSYLGHQIGVNKFGYKDEWFQVPTRLSIKISTGITIEILSNLSLLKLSMQILQKRYLEIESGLME